MWKRILELDVQCPFTSHGCLWTGELRARATHLANCCQHIDTSCKYGCGEKLELSELVEHLDSLCPNRPVTCSHCNIKGKHEFINGSHKSECPEVKVDCPNNCGASDTKRRSLKKHLEECPLEIVECEYSYAGCNVKLRRNCLSEHQQKDFQSHIAFLTNFFKTELEKNDLELKKSIEKSNEQFHQLTDYYTQELKEKEELIAKLSSEREEEIERRLKKNEKQINQQLDKIAEEFERKYEELKLNIGRLDHLPLDVSLEIDHEQLEMISLLHRGKYNAEIWLGKYNGKQIAIKRPLSGTSPSEILQEAHTLKKLEHINIVTLYDTITTGEPVCMILEYMPCGNLENYLQNNPLLLHQQISICKQVAFGLDYLERKLCIHRRVRVDNVLVGEKLKCKINDFSSAIFVHNPDEEYLAAKGFKIRVKWSAPEVLHKKRFCLKSDVWAYGILMWQVISCSKEPYFGLTVDEAKEHICTGTHMLRPKGCSEAFYTLMLDCWKLDPQTRLTYKALVELLDHVKDSHRYTEVQ